MNDKSTGQIIMDLVRSSEFFKEYYKRMRAERDEARRIARQMMAERDEWRAKALGIAKAFRNYDQAATSYTMPTD